MIQPSLHSKGIAMKRGRSIAAVENQLLWAHGPIWASVNGCRSATLTFVPGEAAAPAEVDLGAVAVPDVALARVHELLAADELWHAGLVCSCRAVVSDGMYPVEVEV